MRIGFVYIYAGSCPVKGAMEYGLHDTPGSQLAARRAWAPFGSAKSRAPVAGNTPALDGERPLPVPKVVGHVGRPKSADGGRAQSDVGAGVDAAVQTTQVRPPGVVAERVAEKGSDATTQTNTAKTTDRGRDPVDALEVGIPAETQTAADNGVDQLIERIKVRLGEMLTDSEETVRSHDFEKWKTENPAFADTMDKYVEEFDAAIENARQAVPGDDVLASLDNLYHGIMLAARIHAFYDTSKIVSAAFEARQTEQRETFAKLVEEAVDAQIARGKTPVTEDALRHSQEAIANLEATIANLGAQKAEDEARIAAQVSDAEQLQSELARVQPLLEAAEAAKTQLEEQNLQLASRASETTANATELATAKASILQEKENSRRLEEELARKQAKLDESNQKASALADNLSRAKAENARLKNTDAETVAAFEELNQERALLGEKARNLQAQVDELIGAAPDETTAYDDLRGGAVGPIGHGASFESELGLDGNEGYWGDEDMYSVETALPRQDLPRTATPSSAGRGRRRVTGTRKYLDDFLGKEPRISTFMLFSKEKASFIAQVCTDFGTTQNLHVVTYRDVREITGFNLPQLKTRTGPFNSSLSVNTTKDNDKRTIMAIYSAVVFQLFFKAEFKCEYYTTGTHPTLEFSKESEKTFKIKFPQRPGAFEFRAGESRLPVTEAGSITKEDAPFFVHTESTTKGEYAEGESAGVV